MRKFIVLYSAPAAAMEKMQSATPEEMQKGMAPWMAWAEKLGPALVDFGTPLGGGVKFLKSNSAPSKSEVNGYSILEAENMEAAKALVAGHPHLDWFEGSSLELFESFPM